MPRTTGRDHVNAFPAGAPKSKQHQRCDYNSPNNNHSPGPLFEAPHARQ